MPRNYLLWGDWNAICDVCGFKFKASQMLKRWDGLMVCRQDWEPRHPQLDLRVRPDIPTVPWTRPQGQDQQAFPACYIWDQSMYTGLATCGCASTGYATPFTSIQLYNLKYPTPGP